MSSYGRPAGGSRLRLYSLVFTLLICAAHTIGIAEATAGAYLWKDVNGRWDDPANWEFQGGGTNNGYPNGVSDGAYFMGPYTANRTIGLPTNQPITVGTIYFGGARRVTLGGSANSVLILDNGPAAFGQIISSGGTSTYVVEPAIRPRSDLLIDIDLANADIDIFRVEQSDRDTRFIKRGPGSLDIFGASSHRGPMIVEHGSVFLGSASGSTIRGHLTIGDGIGAEATARVSVEGTGQFVPDVAQQTVIVNADGRFDVKYRSTIPRLEINDGEVQVMPADAGLAVRDLVMRGGVLTAGGDAIVDLAGQVTTSLGAGASIPVMRRFPTATPSTARIHLSETVRITTACVIGVQCLDIWLPVTGGPAAQLIKDGLGLIRFSGSLPNTYAGDTVVEEGVLWSGRADGTQTLAGVIRVGGVNKGLATLRLTNVDTVADSANLVVGTNGQLLLQYPVVAERVQSLAVNGGRVMVGNGGTANTFFPTVVTMTGGRIDILQNSALVTTALDAASIAGSPALITGAGKFATGGAAPRIRTADGPEAVDLLIESPVDELLAQQSIALDGPGVTQFAAINPLTRTTTLAAGTLLVTGTHQQGAITQGGGRLGGTGTIGTLTATSGHGRPGPRERSGQAPHRPDRARRERRVRGGAGAWRRRLRSARGDGRHRARRPGADRHRQR